MKKNILKRKKNIRPVNQDVGIPNFAILDIHWVLSCAQLLKSIYVWIIQGHLI